MKKRGFTIIELLMVVAILAVLLTIIVSAAKGALVAARRNRAESLCKLVRIGINAYRSQYNEWPGPLGDHVRNNDFGSMRKYFCDGKYVDNLVVLSLDESHRVIRELVAEAKKGNPLIDISGLFVSRSRGGRADHAPGMDFMDAIRGTKQSRKKMKMAEMNFGFPDEKGEFRYFEIVYDTATDDVNVLDWGYNLYNMYE